MFTREALAEADAPRPGVVEPGTPPRAGGTAYWFGPRLGERRAILAVQRPLYTTHYQVPEDGCRSSVLPEIEGPAPPGWGPGRELTVENLPAGRPAARRLVRAAFGESEGERAAIATGEEARFASPGGDQLMIVVGSTLVVVRGGAQVAAGRIGELRPVGG